MTNMHGVPDPTKYKFISDDGKREFSVEEYVAIVDDPKRTQPIPMAVPRDPTDPAHVAMVARLAPKRTATAVPPLGRVTLAVPSIEVATIARLTSPVEMRTATPTRPSAEAWDPNRLPAALDRVEKLMAGDIAARREKEQLAAIATIEARGFNALDAVIVACEERPDLFPMAATKPVVASTVEDEHELLATKYGSAGRKDLVKRAYDAKVEREADLDKMKKDVAKEYPNLSSSEVDQYIIEFAPELTQPSEAEQELAEDRQRDHANADVTVEPVLDAGWGGVS